MTHEEVMTDIARKELRSYKQLPQIWYQIQTKFRDEPRPRSGLLRVRQFIMKDSYSFDIDSAGLDKSYDLHDAAYRRIFDRSGLKYVVVEADSGAMGGSQSQEFMVYTDAGEDLIVSCPTGDYAANIEKATSRLSVEEDLAPTGNGLPEPIYTPGKGAIADIVAFLQISAKQDIKCVAYMVDYLPKPGASKVSKALAVFLRGDHTVNEAKLGALVGFGELRPMSPEELEVYFKAPAGFLGPCGLNVATADDSPVVARNFSTGEPIEAAMMGGSAGQALLAVEGDQVVAVIDEALRDRENLVCGANRLDYHLRNVTPKRDFQWTVPADIRNVVEGEGCPICGKPLKVAKAVEIGHIFKLGKKYTTSMGASVLDESGKEITPIMGCYGIGIERILTASIEQNNDKNGFWLPPAIAPFEVVVTVTNTTDAELVSTGERVTAELEAAGFDVILDDRDERAGVKFKDADLIGIPYRINVGKKAAEGKVELVTRATSSSQDVEIGEVATLIAALIEQ
jgi:prolyl-tRNA synthetase